MKKTYIAPTVNVFEIKAKRILMASDPVESIKQGEAEAGGETFSRSFSFGDEE